jgi:hypothetical protein
MWSLSGDDMPIRVRPIISTENSCSLPHGVSKAL